MTSALTSGPLGGAVAARRAARDILAESRFHAAPIPRPLHGFLHAIGKLWHPIGQRIDDTFNSIAGSLPGGSAVLWTIIAVIVLAAIATLTARSTGRILHEAGGTALPRGARVSAETLEREATEAERDGRWQDAVRLRFQAGLMRLSEQELIEAAASTPNAQLRRALHSERFDGLARRFDEIVYGGDEAREQDAHDARREWPRLLGGGR